MQPTPSPAEQLRQGFSRKAPPVSGVLPWSEARRPTSALPECTPVECQLAAHRHTCHARPRSRVDQEDSMPNRSLLRFSPGLVRCLGGLLGFVVVELSVHSGVS